MRKVISTLVLALLAGILTSAASAHAAPLRHTSPAHTACVAFRTWDHHRTTRNLHLAVSAARLAPAVIRTDVTVVAYDVAHNYRLDLPGDVAGTLQDCRGK